MKLSTFKNLLLDQIERMADVVVPKGTLRHKAKALTKEEVVKSFPLIEGKTKSNIKNNIPKEKLAPPPPPIKR